MDAEIATFIRMQPSDWGYAQLATACRQKFGDRAPSTDEIRLWWLRHGGSPHGREKIARDPELVAFISDLAGRQSPQRIFDAICGKFPPNRHPSRSTFYRFVSRVVSEASLREPLPARRRGRRTASPAANAEGLRS